MTPTERARRVLLEVRKIRDKTGQVTERDWIQEIEKQIKLAEKAATEKANENAEVSA